MTQYSELILNAVYNRPDQDADMQHAVATCNMHDQHADLIKMWHPTPNLLSSSRFLHHNHEGFLLQSLLHTDQEIKEHVPYDLYTLCT